MNNMECLECNRVIEEDEWMVMNEHGPLGIFEPTEVGKVHMSCYLAMVAEEEAMFEEEEWEGEDIE